MMKNGDKLLKQFFGEHKQEIANNGFSKRVMHRLPNRSFKLSQIWIALCTTAALILFFVLDGLQALIRVLREVFVSVVQQGAENLDIRSLLIVAAVLLFFGLHKALTLE